MAANDDELASGAVRRNVSIPADLERRMRACSDSHRVNWSQVAARAFEEELRYIEIRKKGSEVMKSTIERWKRGMDEAKKVSQEQGYADGREWAADDSEYHEAKAVAELRQQESPVTASAVWQAANADTDWTFHDFWERFAGSDYEKIVNDDYAEGFVKGVGEVWDELQASL